MEEHGNPLAIFHAEGDIAGKQVISRMELVKLFKPIVLDEITDVLEKNYATLPKNRYISPEEKERIASGKFLADKYGAVRDWHKSYIELLGTPSLPFKPQNETVFRVDDVPLFLPNYSTENYFVAL
ncbi:hypothetical protein EON65_40205 [archaeon]|nr:MAG: hypothetical protein EON65_40205 [archaeon]